MLKKCVWVVVASLFFLLGNDAFSRSNPKDVIDSYTEEMNQIMATSLDQSVKNEKLNVLMARVFDFNQIAKVSLSTHWETLNKSKQDEFVTAFSGLMRRTYIEKSNKLLSNVKLDFVNEKKTKESVSLKYQAKKDEDEIDVVYEMRHKQTKAKDEWLIADMIIDDSSLVMNYRSQFNRFLQKNTIDALIERMSQKSS